MNSYRERVWPAPALLISLVLLIPATLLVFLPVNITAGIGVAVLLYLVANAVLIALSPRITVGEDRLRVDQAHLPGDAIGEVASFDGDEARAERGIRLDARAWLAIRGGVSPIVRIEVVDERDPVPYWVISTRRPRELVAALEELKLRTRGR